MKKWLGIILFFFILTSIFLFNPRFSFSQSLEEQYRAKQKEIEELEKKISELQSKEKTLSSQISYMDSQIKITLLKIGQTEEEIAMLASKIEKLEISLDNLAQILNKRIVATYKKGDIDPFTLLFSSRKFSDFFSRYKYLKVVQIHDRKLMISMEETRTNYDERKTEIEKLKEKLESQKKLLAQQKKDKEYLLGVTRNDEKRFREMLIQAKAEAAAIERILAGQGAISKIGPVKAGEVIGTYISGPSACSSGTHLHFEVIKDGSHQNPANFLKNISLIFEDNVAHFTPSGFWDWPISEPIRITQEYGNTFWSRLGWYGGGPHTGIDMVSGTTENPGPRTVKAVQDGNLYRGSIPCGGGNLRYARIDHPDGTQTYYLHLD
jgi:peptidoglycan hydrolase CwlO-like protein